MNILITKGTTSFCDGHLTRYWRFAFTDIKRKVFNQIETFDNDLAVNKTYHCYIDYGGCIGHRSYSTNSFKDAIDWMIQRLKNYIK